jgi:hypothetical protein
MEQNKSVTYIQRKHVCFLKGSHFAYLLVAVHPRCVKVHFLSLHHPTSRISIDFTTVPTRKEELAMQGGTRNARRNSQCREELQRLSQAQQDQLHVLALSLLAIYFTKFPTLT